MAVKTRNRSLPFVYLNVAATLDGKIAPANRRFVPFTSKRDQELLLELRARSDAVMAGARTVDTAKVTMGPGGPRYRAMRVAKGLAAYNLRVVVSGTGTLNPKAEIFRHRFSPIVVLTTERADGKKIRRLREVADEVKAFGVASLDFKAALAWLQEKWNVKRLLSEGGGEINAGLLEANLVDEIYLTFAPLILGGRNAPTMADGLGVEKIDEGARLKLKSMEQAGNELYLAYTVLKK